MQFTLTNFHKEVSPRKGFYSQLELSSRQLLFIGGDRIILAENFRERIFAENFGEGEADDEYIPQQPVGCEEIDEEENDAIVKIIKKIGM